MEMRGWSCVGGWHWVRFFCGGVGRVVGDLHGGGEEGVGMRRMCGEFRIVCWVGSMTSFCVI